MIEPKQFEAWIIWHPHSDEGYTLGSICYEKSSAIEVFCEVYLFKTWKQAYRQGFRAKKVLITPQQNQRG